ncbi:hypothetical protein [Thermococcus sp. JCM 11816]|uniref:hypothetical protein n=1 Tax=Thermococcus sp. (strain JCM 11816 / KS-1) TaxID=1295125 RepID=UPI003466F489
MPMTNPLKNRVLILLLVLFVVITVLSTTPPWMNKISESIRSAEPNVTAVYIGTTAPPTERGSSK